MSERFKPQKTEIKYGAKNSFGETYDEVERDLRSTAIENVNLPEGKGKSIEELTQEQRDTPNSQERLDEFRVKDPELAREMAEAENDERSKAAALRLLDKGIRRFSDASMRISKPGTFSQNTYIAQGSGEQILDAADRASGHHIISRNDSTLKFPHAPVDVRRAHSEAMREATETKYKETVPLLQRVKDGLNGGGQRVAERHQVTLSDLRREITPLAKKHDQRAEELGEQAAKRFIKDQNDKSKQAA